MPINLQIQSYDIEFLFIQRDLSDLKMGFLFKIKYDSGIHKRKKIIKVNEPSIPRLLHM